MKKTLALLLSLLIALGALFTAIAAAPVTTIASGTCGADGDNLTWELKSTGELIIGGSGAMEDFTYGAAPWFTYRSQITSLTVGEDVTYIGSNSFGGCTLTNVRFNGFVAANPFYPVPASITGWSGTYAEGFASAKGIPFTSLGAERTWQGGITNADMPELNGAGDTFMVYTARELAWVAYKVMSGTSFAEYTVRLERDLDLAGKLWIPIGGRSDNITESTANYFSGVFDGGGHTIKNMTVSSYCGYCGLFGYAKGVIQDVLVLDAEVVSNGSYSGALAGYGTYIFRCGSSGTIRTQGQYVGGVTGYVGSIFSSYSDADVSGIYAGGLAGRAATIANCYATGDVDLASGTTAYLNAAGRLASSCFVVAGSYATGSLPDSGAPYCNTSYGTVGGVTILSKDELKSPNIVEALNASICEEGRFWKADTENVNGGYPVFSNEYMGWKNYSTTVIPQNNIYTINTAAELAWIAAQCNAGNTFAGSRIELNANVDLDGKCWTPIGSGNTGSFEGIFNGGGYTISNMTIGCEELPYSGYAGLFGQANGALISYIAMKDVDIRSAVYASGLVAMNRGTVRNCYATGNINRTESVGGLIGDNSNFVKNCYAIGNVSGKRGVAALVGAAYNTPGTVSSTASSYWYLSALQEVDGLPRSDGGKRGVGNGTDQTVGATLEELRTRSTFVGWDFDAVWGISGEINGGLPYLRGLTPGEAAVSGLDMSKARETISGVGRSVWLNVRLAPANAVGEVVWSSGDESVATVSQTGRVTSVAAGEAVITAVCGTFSASCTVTVIERGMNEYTINSVTIRSAPGGGELEIPDGGFWAEARVTRNAGAGSGVVVLACYSETGKFLGLNYLSADVPDGTTYSLGCWISTSGVGEVRAYVWSSLAAMLPIAAPVSVKK